MKFDLYTKSGEKKGSVEGSDKIFGVKPNQYLIARATLRQQDNARRGTAHTKTRGEIAFSTKKIYAQKHTGQARHGAKSANLFRKGGITFGPRSNVNWKTLMPKKQRRLALFSALSIKALEKSIFCLEPYEGQIKTKPFADMLAKLPPLKDKKKLLIVIDQKNPLVEKSSSNLPNVKTILSGYLNIADCFSHDALMFVGDAMKKTEEIFLPSS